MEISKPRVTAKDFFMWLSAMAFLYASVVSIIALSWSYIDAWVPDALDYGDVYSSGLRFAIAALVVVFPIYIFLMRILHQDLRKHIEKKELWVRRWLIYLTLFIAGVTIAIDLVALINMYLQGTLTARFALKALAILGVVSVGFAYYAYELKGTWERLKKESEIIAGVASLLVIAMVVGAFFIIGSPETARLVKIDERKVSDLQNIQWQVVSYWQQKQKLPGSIADLEDPLTGFIASKDPDTGESYVYKPGEGMSFTLCATFNVPSRESSKTEITRPVPVGGFMDENWKHEAGEVCFERVIDPDRFPALPK